MSEFEKLYTVEDIARMTMLTTRTIRNYLKEGLLTGRKVGGQWRFTKQEVESLFENNSVEEDMKNNRRQEVMDFIDGINTDVDGEIQLCTIADYYCPDLTVTQELSNRFCEIISSRPETAHLRYFYEYIDKEQKARYTFFGAPVFIKSMVAVLEDEWNRLNASQDKFSGKSDNYDKYRPPYPQEMIDFICTAGNQTSEVFADIGSGTGKVAEFLLKKNKIVYAVEPNEDMRKIAEKSLGENEKFHSLNQTAENTTIKTDSVDNIICGESYHWLDNIRTKLEFKRILKKEGFIFLLWTTPGQNEYDQELGILFQQFCNKNNSEIINVSKEERAIHLFGEGNYKKAEFKNIIDQTFEGLLGGCLSSAFAPKPGDADYAEYVEAIRDIFDRYSQAGKIKTTFITRCFYGIL